jgi:hypothetical protein
MIKTTLIIALILSVMTMSYWPHTESINIQLSKAYQNVGEGYWVFLIFTEEANVPPRCYLGKVTPAKNHLMASKSRGRQKPNSIAMDALHPKSILD